MNKIKVNITNNNKYNFYAIAKTVIKAGETKEIEIDKISLDRLKYFKNIEDGLVEEIELIETIEEVKDIELIETKETIEEEIKYICPKCQKEYKDKMWFEKHIEKCDK